MRSIIETEFYNIEKHLNNINNKNNIVDNIWIPLSNYYEKIWIFENPNDRIFFAHAGLPVSFVEYNPYYRL